MWLYQEPIQSLISAAKFGGQWSIFGALCGELIRQRDPIHVDYIIAMPLHPNRLKERGFNQALEIAQMIAKQWHLPLKNKSLLRIRDTEHQARLNAKARRKNLKGAFVCQHDYTNKSILLVDDVMTSGASLHEAAAALKKAGAAQVFNLVLARTPDHTAH
ncbi:phosphoribosyltransferase family protein [Chitinibacter sp. SCUT-21]|uniref:ComF family protein n=1 Tax=Chitinibacter sp. SCUT-21 TaxID=2970891 RepID=UPI0035A64129